jgi:hypothetical protein
MAEIQLALYRLSGIDWPRLDVGLRDELLRRFLGRGILGEEGRRFGLWQPRQFGSSVVGTFAHQTTESLTDYRETPSGLERVQADVPTFENYAFVIWFAEEIVALQRRRLPATKTLTTEEVERDFQRYVSDAALGITNRFVTMRPFAEESNEENVRELLTGGRVLRIRVGNLAGKSVPDVVDLTNPRPDADGILHEYMNYDLRRGVNEVTIQADPGQEDADVSSSFYAKGVLASGTLEEAEVVIAGRRVRQVRENRQATIRVEEPITPEVATVLLARILHAEYDLTPIDEQPTLFGPQPA